jgi:hypothetical protein
VGWASTIGRGENNAPLEMVRHSCVVHNWLQLTMLVVFLNEGDPSELVRNIMIYTSIMTNNSRRILSSVTEDVEATTGLLPCSNHCR